MNLTPLYPLRLEPMYQYRLWGGRRLATLLGAQLPGTDPVGEAWLLSDRDDHASVVAEGALKGRTIRQLLRLYPQRLLGTLSGRFDRFPLLLKFLDVSKTLSVQVHPSDAYQNLIPPGDTGKTEAWIVLAEGPEARIYAGLRATNAAAAMWRAIAAGTVPELLASFKPKCGDAVFIRAGIVHSLSDVVVFEVQQNSDVTFRLYDWDHVDPRTGKRRPLQVDKAMECIDFDQGAIGPITAPQPQQNSLLREKLIACDHFGVTRIRGRGSFVVGAAKTPRVFVCIAGDGHLESAGTSYGFGKGDVLLLPAEVGACLCHPHDEMSALEVSLPGAA